MSNGPIEYLGEPRDRRMPPSEYGGEDGLLQPAPHEPTASEARGMVARAAMRPLSPVEQRTGEVMGDAVLTDPHTGRPVSPELLI
jgi:hypothetical protein